MKSATVTYFDGRVSTRREVVLTLDGVKVTLRGDGVDIAYPVSDISIPPEVGSVRRTIRLPDGGVCELDDGELLAELERAMRREGRPRYLLHRWEKSLPLALAAVAVTVLVVLLFVRYGVPSLARRAAFALPAATETSMGRESLATLDRILMKPSTLNKGAPR